MKLKHFVLTYVLLLVIFSSCTFSLFNTNREGNALVEKLDSIIKPLLDSQMVAGAAIGVAQNGTFLLRESYGFADLEWNIPMPIDASFEIGSVTKQFTGVAILQLAEQGKLSLEDDFTKYIDFDTDGRKISINQLLHHTSGIKSYTQSRQFMKVAFRELPRDTMLRLMETEPFDFEPGEAQIYNNTAYFILGLVIEKLSNKTYAEYIEENIFDKAGMHNSYYKSVTEIVKKRAKGYQFYEGQLYHASYLHPNWPYSAGSLCSTVEDLLKWNQALHNGKILNAKMYEELLSVGTLNDGTTLRYAKGITLDQYKGYQMIEHGGGIPGFLSSTIHFPEENLTIVSLFNTSGPAAPSDIAKELAGFLLDFQEADYKKYEGNIEKLIGTYQGPGRGQSVTVKVTTADNYLVVEDSENNTPDTLHYVGNEKWISDNTFYQFKKSNTMITGLRKDHKYGHYILQPVVDNRVGE